MAVLTVVACADSGASLIVWRLTSCTYQAAVSCGAIVVTLPHSSDWTGPSHRRTGWLSSQITCSERYPMTAQTTARSCCKPTPCCGQGAGLGSNHSGRSSWIFSMWSRWGGRRRFKFCSVAKALKSWSSKRIGSIRLQLSLAREVILGLDVAEESRALSDEEKLLRNELKMKCLGLASLNRTILRQRSKILYLAEGDANTKKKFTCKPATGRGRVR